MTRAKIFETQMIAERTQMNADEAWQARGIFVRCTDVHDTLYRFDLRSSAALLRSSAFPAFGPQ
jgi:hypothetical protein